MSLVEHLGELRRRLITCVIAVFVGMVAAYCAYNPWIRSLLLAPIDSLARNEDNPFMFDHAILALVRSSTPKLKELNLEMHAMGPVEGFMVRMKSSICAGAVLTSPFILYQVWAFIATGLRKKERSALFVFLPAALLLFICGVLLAYFVMLPVALCFMMVIGNEGLVQTLRFREYVPLVVWFCVGLGLVFETPILILFLTKVGIVTPQALAAKRKYAILGIFVLAAILTPPDVITQIMLALPMIILYEISIILSKFAWAKRQKKLAG